MVDIVEENAVKAKTGREGVGVGVDRGGRRVSVKGGR